MWFRFRRFRWGLGSAFFTRSLVILMLPGQWTNLGKQGCPKRAGLPGIQEVQVQFQLQPAVRSCKYHLNFEYSLAIKWQCWTSSSQIRDKSNPTGKEALYIMRGVLNILHTFPCSFSSWKASSTIPVLWILLGIRSPSLPYIQLVISSSHLFPS